METISAWQALRAFARPSGVIGGITEAAWMSAHLLLYPWGARPEAAVPDRLRVDDLGPITRGRLVGDIATRLAARWLPSARSRPSMGSLITLRYLSGG